MTTWTLSSPAISQDDFTVIAIQCGLELTPSRRQEMYDAYIRLQAMLAYVHKPCGAEIEPATVFIAPGSAVYAEK